MKKFVLSCTFAVGLVLGSAAAANAGEITGGGDPTPIGGFWTGDGAASICSFSGLNDTYTGDPDVPDEEGFTRTQNWGQLPAWLRKEVRAGNSPDPHLAPPNAACNPTLF